MRKEEYDLIWRTVSALLTQPSIYEAVAGQLQRETDPSTLASLEELTKSVEDDPPGARMFLRATHYACIVATNVMAEIDRIQGDDSSG